MVFFVIELWIPFTFQPLTSTSVHPIVSCLLECESPSSNKRWIHVHNSCNSKGTSEAFGHIDNVFGVAKIISSVWWTMNSGNISQFCSFRFSFKTTQITFKAVVWMNVFWEDFCVFLQYGTSCLLEHSSCFSCIWLWTI